VPIHREDRDQAVQAISAAAGAALLGECMAIAPEGTRSLSGQLLPFKKGPFYLWETLQTPIIPIVTMGAFELFPPGSQMTQPGKVYVQFLDPILPHEANSKEAMSILVRTRMLEALKAAPSDVAVELTWHQRVVCWTNLVAVYLVAWYLYRLLQHCSVVQTLQVSHYVAWMLCISVCVIITLIFYAYAVYMAPIVRLFLAKTARRATAAVSASSELSSYSAVKTSSAV
jgi:hypothetical protein